MICYRIRAYYVLYIISCFISVNAILPPIISQKIIISQLESIITTRAFASSFFENFNKEIDFEKAILQIAPMHYSTLSGYVYLSIVLTFIYSQWRFYDEIYYERFGKIAQFAKEKKIIKNIIFIIILVFMKDIQSSS
jgi:hypothetical protein